jgi:LDH2 family malate/lactate/ureidoglycolate dehydrogenase
MEKGKLLVSSETLLALAQEIFIRVGLGKRDAKIIADHLIEANLRGVESHGLSRIPIYVKRMREGLVNLKGEIGITQETPASALINGNNLPGILVAQKAIEISVAKAQSSGMAVVGVNQSNHCGMLASYAKYAVKNGCIAIITSNASPSMAPWGGKESFFGTNPICYGIPAGMENHIIMDMATSVVAKGKIRLAEKNRQLIPNDWAISREGHSTTDPTEALAGLVLPFGGPKGYGLVLLIDVLSAILTGANNGPHVSSMFESKVQGIGHFFMVIRADIFQPFDTFTSKIDQMIKEIRSVKSMEGVNQIYLPGEIELEMEKRRRLEGIPLSESLIQDLRQIGRDLKLDMEGIFQDTMQ